MFFYCDWRIRRINNYPTTNKTLDLGQFPIQPAQIITAFGKGNAYLATIILGSNETLTFSAPSKIKTKWKILHITFRTLEFRGWGYFCDQILFHIYFYVMFAA